MRLRICAAAAVTALGALICAGPAAAAPQPASQRAPTTTPIKHFIFLMQGSRTFDNYFGTYPGADGPSPGACQPRVAGNPHRGCIKPFPLSRQPLPLGASRTTILSQYNRGKMNGFVSAYQRQGRNGTSVMGYYDRRELPFYWDVARSYVLFDHFFSSALFGIRTNRSYWVSAAPTPRGTEAIPPGGYGKQRTIFDRLQAAGIPWKFYVQDYRPHETYQTVSPNGPRTQTARVPLVDYRRFTHDAALEQHIVGLGQFYKDLRDGTLPAVAYIASSSGDNERSAGSISGGQSLVRGLVTQLMESRYWASSALLWSYDGSGGWFDHVRPPRVGSGTLGFRVPALLVSAYARKGQVNHTVLDYASALKFIERNWRITPLTARDARARGLASAFNFAARPRAPALIQSGSPGAADGYSPAPPPQPAPAKTVYALYGSAAGAAVLLVLFAACWPALSARRREMSARRAPRRGGTDP